jgi:predicted HTH domain antitoxin
MPATSTVSTRLNDAEVALIQSLAELEGCDRATLIKTLLRNGLEHLRRERAVDAYRQEKVTLSRAAELAGLSPWDFLALMESAKVDLHYDVSDFRDDLSRLP